ncbi:MAG: hypothetical protein DSZ26_03505 [Thermovibrio sp.]|nr:MAG: hypothetical protein DSZ26_03505 [Thermovibrio sp.]
MKSLKVVFKNGTFVPLEPAPIPEGTEGIVVYLEKEEKAEKPKWWDELSVDEEKRRALLRFSLNLRKRISYIDVKVVEEDEGFEVFLLVDDETSSLKPAMEEALKIYEEEGVYIPLQVISKRRLNRWREMGSTIYKRIEEGVSIG